MIPLIFGGIMNFDTLTISKVILIIRFCDNNHITIIRREKNLDFLYKNDIAIDQAKDFVRSLAIEDFVKGPLKDSNPTRKHPLWVFKKRGFDHICYIKLKIVNKRKETVVVSFHEDEN